MFATMGAWKRPPLAAKVEQSSPQKSAAETRNDAQDLDKVAEFAHQHNTVAGLEGFRIQNWPQFFVLWQIIGCVSAYDAFLAMKYRNELSEMEQNPLGQLLLMLNDGDPALFLGVKFLGTTMV